MRTVILSIVLGVVLLFISPITSFAAGIVPCDGVDCQTCHFVRLGNNILNWIIGVMASICAVFVAVAGLKMATAGGDTGAVSAAKEMITNTIVGFIILLSAWLIVDTVMRVFVGGDIPNFGPWNSISCVDQPVVTRPADPVAPQCATASDPVACSCELRYGVLNLATGECEGGSITTGPGPTAGCPTCAAMPSTIPTNGNPCAGGPNACVMIPEIANSLVSANLTSLGMRLSEGYPPTVQHAEACHAAGTCVDVSFNQNSPTGAQVQANASALRSQGFTPVYEVPTEARAAELRAQGAQVLVVPGIGREHYSVYRCNLDSTPRACR